MGTIGGWITSEVGLGLLRNMLMAAGASLVTQGIITQGQLTGAVGALAVIVGIIISAISNHDKAQAKAVVSAVNANPALVTLATSGGAPMVLVKNVAGGNWANDPPPPSLSSVSR